MAKVITHEEVNALISGVFPSDPKKAVLYGDLSTDERFVVNANNSVTNTPYKDNQALLDADIRVRGSLTVTIAPASATVLSTATQMVFNITTGGTGTITNWSVVSATLAGADRKAYTSFNSAHTQITMTIPANTEYTSKTGAVQISVTTSDETFNSNVAQCTQNPASRLAFVNATSSQSSSATTTTQAFTNNNCTNVAVQSKSTGVNASISGSNVVITFPKNTGDASVTRTVTISGKTADNVTTSTTHTITQSARVETKVTITYTGGSINASGETTDKFTVSATGVTVTGYSVDGGARIDSSSSTRPTVEFPPYQNPQYMKQYNVVVYGTDIYDMPASGTCQVTQNMDLGSFSLSANTNPVEYYVTSNTLSIYNVTDMTGTYGFVSGESVGIDTCSIQGLTVTVTFSQNSGSATEKKVVITGTTTSGRVVKRNATFTQTAGQSAYLAVSFSAPASGLPASDTTCGIVIQSQQMDTATIGWDQSRSVFITNCNVQNSTVSFNANTGYTSRELVLWITGTSLVGQDLEASATCIQNRVEVTPKLEIEYTGTTQSSSSGSTSQFNITKNAYVTAVTGYSVDCGATISSSGATNVTVSFPANTGSTEVTYTVSVYGTDVYGETVSGSTTFKQSSDAYEFRLNPAATAVTFTSTGITLGIVSSNVNSIGVSSHVNTTSETISGNDLVLGYDINESPSSRNITVSLSGVTNGGVEVSCSAVITQSGASGLELNIEYMFGTMLPASAGTTSYFVVTKGSNVTILGYSVDVQGASVATGATVTDITLTYPNNQTLTPVVYTITVTGSTPIGNVTDSCTVTQKADTIAFELQPVLNPISADATSAGFNLTATSVNSIGYYVPESLNVTGISGLTQNSVTATGISVNTGSSSKTIRLVLSGTTVGGRTVYATGTTVQSTADVASITITYNGTRLPASSGSTNDFTVTSVNARVTGYTVSPSPASASTTGETSLTLDYPQNPSTSSTVSYYITPVGVHLQTGVQVVGNTCEVVQGADTDWSFSVSPDSGNIPWDAVATSFTAVHTNVSEIEYYSGTNISSHTKSGDIYSVVITENPGHEARSIEITLSGKTPGGNVVYASGTLTQGAKPYNPDIWWTKTSEGQKSTEVTSVNDVPAFVAGTYDGRNVVYTVYVNYNSDVSTFSLDDSLLDGTATATTSGKAVTITVRVNTSLSTRSLGSLTVTGTAPDGTTMDSATLTIVQVAGVDPRMSFTLSPQTVGATTTNVTDTLTYDYVDPSSIRTSSMSGNITNVNLS